MWIEEAKPEGMQRLRLLAADLVAFDRHGLGWRLATRTLLAFLLPLLAAQLLALPVLVYMALGGFLIAIGDSIDDGDRHQFPRIAVGALAGAAAVMCGVLAGGNLFLALAGTLLWCLFAPPARGIAGPAAPQSRRGDRNPDALPGKLGLSSASGIRVGACRSTPASFICRRHASLHPRPEAPRQAGLHHGRDRRDGQPIGQLDRSIQPYRPAVSERCGLERSDHIALYLENNPRFFEICWGAQRAGLVYSAISSRLTAPEVEYIVKDCGAKLFVTSTYLGEKAAELAPLIPEVAHRFMIGGTLPGYRSWEEAVANQPATRIADETAGHDMLYSSGTTGRPKGVLPVVPQTAIDSDNPLNQITRALYGMDDHTVYLSPAPLYHAAPLRFNMSVMKLGGTSVIMENFDAEEFLRLVPKFNITHTQLVPTMFVRFLKLPDEVRLAGDMSSFALRHTRGGALPHPREGEDDRVVRPDHLGVLRWHRRQRPHPVQLGANGWRTRTRSASSVRRPAAHLCDDAGHEVRAGQGGHRLLRRRARVRVPTTIPGRPARSRNAHGWTTLGDVGYVDADGFTT